MHTRDISFTFELYLNSHLVAEIGAGAAIAEDGTVQDVWLEPLVTRTRINPGDDPLAHILEYDARKFVEANYQDQIAEAAALARADRESREREYQTRERRG